MQIDVANIKYIHLSTKWIAESYSQNTQTIEAKNKSEAEKIISPCGAQFQAQLKEDPKGRTL